MAVTTHAYSYTIIVKCCGKKKKKLACVFALVVDKASEPCGSQTPMLSNEEKGGLLGP